MDGDEVFVGSNGSFLSRHKADSAFALLEKMKWIYDTDNKWRALTKLLHDGGPWVTSSEKGSVMYSAQAVVAALDTVLGLKYTYLEGAELWGPPLGKPAQLRDVPHAKEQLEWLTRPDAVVWFQMSNGTWEPLADPLWDKNNKYLVLPPGEKPPAEKNPLLPETKAPLVGADYWTPTLNDTLKFDWRGDVHDVHRLCYGLVYLDKRGAIAASERHRAFIVSQAK
jgi:hypothetical protein